MMTNDTHIDLQSRMQSVLADPGFQSDWLRLGRRQHCRP